MFCSFLFYLFSFHFLASISACSWKMFVEDPTKTEWPLRLPMTKGVMKCMDAIQNFTLSLHEENPAITPLKEFAVAGGSKRGWTTWTTGAADPRVIAIYPLVMDLLNVVENIHHHFRAYGGWAFALQVR